MTPTRKPALSDTSIALGGAEVTYFRGGKGRVLFYLHGGDGLYAAAPVLEALQAHFDVIAPVHPGFEHAPLPGWMDSIDDYAHLYIALLDHLNVKDAILFGASIGGWIAAEIATKNKSRIARMVLAAPVGVKTGPSDKLDVPDIYAMRERPLRKLMYHDPEKGLIDTASKTDADLTAIARNRETAALVSWDPFMHNPKLRHRLAAVETPTLFLRGASDGIVSDAYLKAYARLLPNASMQTITNAGHLLHVEQPDALCAAIVNFAATA